MREECITKAHKNRIEVQQTERDKNKELLSIMKRRSYEDFKTFKHVIRATQKDGMIIKLLEQGSGMCMTAGTCAGGAVGATVLPLEIV